MELLVKDRGGIVYSKEGFPLFFLENMSRYKGTMLYISTIDIYGNVENMPVLWLRWRTMYRVWSNAFDVL